METTEPRRPGRKPRNEIIEREVRRRLAAGEPITNRAIRAAVGGSPATITSVLVSMNLGTDARGNVEREIQLRERIKEAGDRVAEAEAFVKGAREAGELMAREITGTLSTVRDASAMLLRGLDELRSLMLSVKGELAANRTASDPLMEARLKKANAENGKMAQRIEEMKRRLHDAGVEDF